MSSASRNGKRKTRQQISNRKQPKLGYYLIVTDTEKTEYNYFKGLTESIDKKDQQNIVIIVKSTENKSMIKTVEEYSLKMFHYVEPWIVFDKDMNNNFDKIIHEAEKKGINVAWSNPCFEIWLEAYFNKMPNIENSVKCCESFSKDFQDKLGHEYKKSDEDIYRKLIQHGDENNAIQIAEKKYIGYLNENKTLPSKMTSCSTMFKIVKEIKWKIKKQTN